MCIPLSHASPVLSLSLFELDDVDDDDELGDVESDDFDLGRVGGSAADELSSSSTCGL